VVLTSLLLVAMIWALLRFSNDTIAEGVAELGRTIQGTPVTSLAPLLMPVAIPFIAVLYVCTLIYLVNALYQDRKDSSILFWQSMPVSNLSTVLSKVATVCFIAPVFVTAAVFVLLIFSIVVIAVYGVSSGVGITGLGTIFIAGLYGLILVYLTGVLAALWLYPTIGWLLLFSAYARGLPFLWAIGGFLMLLLIEDLIFNTQFLINWLQSRTTNYNYIVFTAGDFFRRLFSYDMLFGIALGALLTTGAVYMRRLSD
jgi:hypothetical protein